VGDKLFTSQKAQGQHSTEFDLHPQWVELRTINLFAQVQDRKMLKR
jgi:hypothetical protein